MSSKLPRGLDIPHLHALAQLEKTGAGSANQQQVDTWKKMAGEVDRHLSALRSAAAELAVTWPPERSDAALAFSKFVADLIGSMETTRGRAGEIATALEGIDSALGTAKSKLAELNKQWGKNAAIEHENNTDNWLESAYDGVAGVFGGGDDLPDNWKSNLENKALKVLNDLQGVVTEAAPLIQAPPRYQAAIDPVKVDPKPRSGAGSHSMTGGPTGTDGRSLRSVASQIPPLSSPVTIGPDGSLVLPPSVDQPTVASPPEVRGPVLASGPTLVAPPSYTPTPPSLGAPPTSGFGPITPPTFGPVIGPGMPPPSVSPMRVLGRGPGPLGGGPRSMTPPGRSGVSPRKIMPSGGIIGEQPGSAGRPSGVGRTGAVGGRPGASGRAGASGRVIGNTPAGRGDTPSAAGRGRSRRRDDDQRGKFDPNDPWRVEQGVAPIIDADEEPDGHDPGPGVIGVDR